MLPVPEHQANLGELDEVAIDQWRLIDPPSVNARAVAGSDVSEQPTLVRQGEICVVLGYGRVIDPQVA